MELTGKLKENVDKAENKEEAKKLIKNAGAEVGIILNEDELDQVSGGMPSRTPTFIFYLLHDERYGYKKLMWAAQSWEDVNKFAESRFVSSDTISQQAFDKMKKCW